MNSDQLAIKWYFKTSTLVIAVLSIGPLALPLLWFNPRVSRKAKIIWSIIIIILSYFMYIQLSKSIEQLKNYYPVFSDRNLIGITPMSTIKSIRI
jgi:hypothetical protein